jgi:hypothetical protein
MVISKVTIVLLSTRKYQLTIGQWQTSELPASIGRNKINQWLPVNIIATTVYFKHQSDGCLLANVRATTVCWQTSECRVMAVYWHTSGQPLSAGKHQNDGFLLVNVRATTVCWQTSEWRLSTGKRHGNHCLMANIRVTAAYWHRVAVN